MKDSHSLHRLRPRRPLVPGRAAPTVCAFLVAVPCMAAAPPSAQLGTAERTTTQPIDAPIDRVTVYSNRARVVRTTRVKLAAGSTTLRFDSLPPQVLAESVRVSAPGARVLRAEVGVVETESVSIPTVQAQLDELESLQRERRVLADKERLESEEVQLIKRLVPAAPPTRTDDLKRPWLRVSVDWRLRTASYFEDRAGGARDRVARIKAQRRPLEERIARLRTKLFAIDLSGAPRRTTEVLAVLHSRSSRTVSVELTYDVMGPTWRPVYDLHYSPTDARLAVYTAAVVRQQTGEDWSDAELAFSTGMPEESIALPRLLTWTLGEKRDFKPEVRPAKRRPAATAMKPPTRQRAERSDALLALRLRRSQLVGKPMRSEDERKKYDAAFQPQVDEAPSPPPPAPARAPSPKRAVKMSLDRQSASDSEEVVVTGTQSGSSGRRRPRLSLRSLALTQAGLPNPLARLSSDTPARMAKGVTYLYSAPARASVASDGQSIKVPVSVERFETEGFYEATPGLSTTAYLRARLTNQSTRPLLAGPTNIFVKDRFIGQGRVQTTAPQRQVEFGLGADESIKVSRKVLPSTRSEGVFTTHSVTQYRVVIEVANYHRRPVKVELLEPIPKSKKDDIEIKVVRLTPNPVTKPDAQGIARFRLELPAGAKRTVELVYEIDRPADFELRQY